MTPLFPAAPMGSAGGTLFPPLSGTGGGAGFASLLAAATWGSAMAPPAAQGTGPGASPAGTPPPVPPALQAGIAQAAAAHGLPASLLAGLVAAESGFSPTARSAAGAMGLTQLMPATAASLGVSQPFDPTQNLMGGASYLSQMLQRFGGNLELALAAYNAGPEAVERYGGIPPYPETQAYVDRVLQYAATYARQGMA
jgi:soluble lytic murein transglycosylase-like protein